MPVVAEKEREVMCIACQLYSTIITNLTDVQIPICRVDSTSFMNEKDREGV